MDKWLYPVLSMSINHLFPSTPVFSRQSMEWHKLMCVWLTNGPIPSFQRQLLSFFHTSVFSRQSMVWQKSNFFVIDKWLHPVLSTSIVHSLSYLCLLKAIDGDRDKSQCFCDWQMAPSRPFNVNCKSFPLPLVLSRLNRWCPWLTNGPIPFLSR